jgi:hypothetical protein
MAARRRRDAPQKVTSPSMLANIPPSMLPTTTPTTPTHTVQNMKQEVNVSSSSSSKLSKASPSEVAPRNLVLGARNAHFALHMLMMQAHHRRQDKLRRQRCQKQPSFITATTAVRKDVTCTKDDSAKP